MAKREADKESHYKNIINKQKSLIKELKKKAGRGHKIEERYEGLELDLVTQIEELESNKFKSKAEEQLRCPDCGKGTLELVDLKIRKMWICSNCSHRVIKK